VFSDGILSWKEVREYFSLIRAKEKKFHSVIRYILVPSLENAGIL
jgi:hypothetical protein